MPVEVVRLADSSMSLKAQPIDMPHGGWCKPPARPVVMICYLSDFLEEFHFLAVVAEHEGNIDGHFLRF